MLAPQQNTDIAIIGAGVIGLACALTLADAGESILLIDRNEPGSGCSRGNAGHIATEQIAPLASPTTLRALPSLLFGAGSPLRIDPRYALKAAPWLCRFAMNATPRRYTRGVAAITSLQSMAMDETARLLERAGAPDLLHRSGHLMLVEKSGSRARVDRSRKNLQALGIRTEWKAPAEIAKLAPDVIQDAEGAVFYPDTGHTADPYIVCQHLTRAFERAGGRLTQCDIETIKPHGANGFLLNGPSGVVTAKRLVIAAGAWSHFLARQLGCAAPLEAERGYHVTVPGYRAKMTVPVASFERNVIVTPFENSLRITGFVEFAGLAQPARQNQIETLKSHLSALAPTIDLKNATSWLGYRPSLPDHLPVMGATRRCENLYFAFGHQHLGLTLAGVSASILTAMMQGRKPPIDPAPFSIDRF
ncbi:MAG: FAD-binding oxidoreductase [Pseudomonadota bacterium]